MKQFFTIIFLLSGCAMLAQNWSPIQINHKMNYQHTDSSYISHTIWVDSAFAVEADSIFYLNRIVKDVPGNPEIVLRNQAQFLMKFMVKQIYGIHTFEYPNHYSILTLSGVGTSWDFSNEIQAEITEIILEDIFGVSDSVKVISLSDGNEIRLSKNFGILKFPDFENEGYYELVGIQNTEYGESVPDFWDIFDFEVGDVFQYDFVDTDASISDYQTQKFTIETKEVFDDSIKYQMYVIIDGHYIDYWSWEEYFYSSAFNKDVCFLDSLNHPTNNYNYEIIRMWEDYWGYSFYFDLFSKISLSKDSLDIITKAMGGTVDSMEDRELYEEINTNSDTLLIYQGWNPGNLMIQYTEGLGRTIYDYWEDEQAIRQYLIGYVKNGDTVGIITPDSLLLTDISHSKSITNNWKVYPNPARTILNIKQSNSSVNYNIELRNLYGQLVSEEKKVRSSHYTLNVADLKAGVYFYVIKDKDRVLQQGKVVIK